MDEKAVVDRIEDGDLAVVLVGDDEVEHVVSLGQLPPGTESGSWLRVEFDGDQLLWAVLDEDGKADVTQRVQEKIQKLRRRGRRL